MPWMKSERNSRAEENQEVLKVALWTPAADRTDGNLDPSGSDKQNQEKPMFCLETTKTTENLKNQIFILDFKKNLK